MNLTITLDEDLLNRARAVARSRGMSLQALLREQLERLVGQPSLDDLATELESRWGSARALSERLPRRADIYDELLDRDGRRG
ncbi:MAG: hypothetical protein KC635_11590 [Myxococcales bacterium]|nr:hypothetical protein [Myxococcales bacterium]MCB9735440.1 hypothetical protein [Deltaproteobacteria bacterium]